MATQDTTREGETGRSRRDGTTGTVPLSNRVKRAASGVIGLALLARGLRRRSLRGVTMALVGGWLLSRTLPERYRSRGTGESAGDGTAVSRSVTIGKPADELYAAWRDPTVFSQVMGHVADVTASTEDRFHWTVEGPYGREVDWETRIVEADPGEIVRWETTADAMLANEGEVRFREATGDRGTEVTLTLRFDPPGGALGDAALRRLDMAPRELAGVALSRFKSLVESGEIPTLSGNPSARGRGDRL